MVNMLHPVLPFLVHSAPMYTLADLGSEELFSWRLTTLSAEIGYIVP